MRWAAGARVDSAGVSTPAPFFGTNADAKISGAGELSSMIDSTGKLTSVTIGGSLLGGAGSNFYTDTSRH